MKTSTLRPHHFRPLSSSLCALAILSLAACGTSDMAPWAEGTFESDFGGESVDHSNIHRYTGAFSAGVSFPSAVNYIRLCGSSSKGDSGGYQVARAHCFNLHIAKVLPGGTPSTLILNGETDLSRNPSPNGPKIILSPREGHSASVRQAWLTPSCGPSREAIGSMQQAVTGTLELSMYDDTTVAGRLVAEVTGQAASECPPQRTRADIRFTLPLGSEP